jgi:hypothetical protein
MGVRAQEIHPGLWQGEWPPPGRWLAERGFSTLVLCAAEYQPPYEFPEVTAGLIGIRSPNPWPGVEVIYAPNNDDVENKPPRETLRLALRAGRIVATRLAQKKRVLTTCWQGRNRSGLVSAFGLYFLGIPGPTATRIVQLRRQGGLRNPVFCDILAKLRDPRQDHPTKAVLASPLAPEAHLHRVSAIWAPQAGFTLPPGVL